MVVGTYSPSYLASLGGRIAWTQEVEVAASQDRALYSSLGDSKTLSQKNNKIKLKIHFKYSLENIQAHNLFKAHW